MFRLHGKKIIKILCTKIFLNWSLRIMCYFRVFTVCKDKINLYIKNTMYNFLGEVLTSDPSMYMHPDLTVSKFMENSNGLKRDNLLAALCP